MKKIAILLALALALSCCLLLLAACGDSEEASSPADTSSAATSSEGTSSAATSSEKEESSSAVSSEEATSSEEEPSSEDPEESGESEPETSEEEPATGGTVESTELTGTPSGDNLALGATVSGADVNTIASQYNAALTDGKAADAISYDGEWFAYWYNTQDADVDSKSNCPGGVAKPTVDLGEVTAIKAARINVFLGNISGIQSPTKFVFEYSEDGQNWTEFGSATYPVLTVEDSTVGWVGFEMSKAVDARYVRVSMTVSGACWTFINEIEVYA